MRSLAVEMYLISFLINHKQFSIIRVMVPSYCFSDLLLHIPNSELNEGNLHLSTPDIKPLFNQTEVTVIGIPIIVTSPIGSGIHITDKDKIIYKFSVSKPWPCPFDINQCPTGLTLSFWFRWEYVFSNYYRYYITLGKVLTVNRPPRYTNNLLQMRWNVGKEFSWYTGLLVMPGDWNLMMWIVNHTHSVGYLNGIKVQTRLKENRMSLNDISDEIHINTNGNAGSFAVGQMRLWAGRKSPVFMWRLFHEGLPDYNEN